MVMEQFPVAGDVAQYAHTPVTGMLPIGGKSEQVHGLFHPFTTRTLCSLLHIRPPHCLTLNDGNRTMISESWKWDMVCVYIPGESLYRFLSSL